MEHAEKLVGHAEKQVEHVEKARGACRKSTWNAQKRKKLTASQAELARPSTTQRSGYRNDKIVKCKVESNFK